MMRSRMTLLLLALSLALLPMSAVAGPPDTSDTSSPEALVEAELMHSLRSDSVALQARAAQRVQAYALTSRYEAALFRDLVVPLHDLVADGRTERVRLLAVAALSAIGTDVAMLGLQVEKDEVPSARLKQATETVLARYGAERATGTVRSQAGE